MELPSWMDDDLAERRRRGLYRRRRRLQRCAGARIVLDGRELIDFSSNDYLDLALDPRLARAAAQATRRWGCGAGASALTSGWSRPLRALERDLAAWKGTEAALVFSSGYIANLALTATLVGRGDAVFSDALNHASLIDGCRLSRAAIHVHRHADLNHLDDLLTRRGRAARRRLIVSDSVFSMDGDLAPLAGLLELAERHDALLLLDEAHAAGVLGDGGRGLSATAAGCERLIAMGTLSKALGSQGGFVCGSRRLIDWLVNRARPYIFSTALAPPSAAAARVAVRLIAEEPERRRRLLELAEMLRRGLREQAWNVGGSCCQIVPLMVGEARAATRLARRLRGRGLFAPAIRPPSVPEGTARLRISLSAGHSEEDVKRLLEALKASGGC
jgi:8-amino-7-oxononanoate synthase